MTDADTPLFDADFLQRLRPLFFRLRRRRHLRRRGTQPSPSLGSTREFKDHRHYVPGDDFRSVDWRLFARSERLYVRRYEAIQELHLHLIVDRSASMAEPFPAKRVSALRLAVALGYLALLNQQRVSVHSFGRNLRQELRPVKGAAQIHKVREVLAALPFGGGTDLDALASFRPGRKQRGIVFVLSDVLGSQPAAAAAALEACARWPAETHIVQVLDPGDLAPTAHGDVELADVETGEQRRMVFGERERRRSARAVEDYVRLLARTCLRRHIDHVTWRTDSPFESSFLDLLTRGSAVAQA